MSVLARPRPAASSDELAGITFMVIASVVTVVAAEGDQRRVAVAASMVLAEAGLLIGRHARRRTQAPGLLLAVAAGLAAMVLSPNGLAEVAVLVAGSRLPRTLGPPWRDVVTAVVAVAFGVAVVVVSGSVVGLLAGLGVWLLAQRTTVNEALQTERDRAVALLAQVQASRDAQAEAAAGAERARIAREMHDVLAHSLAGLSLQLQAARAIAVREGVGEAVTVPLERAADLAREGVAEARAAVGALSGAPTPTTEAVADLVARFPGTASSASTGTAAPLPAAAGHAVYRAVQESLTNAARYAPGAPVRVELAWSAVALIVTVSDEGSPRPDPIGASAATGSGLSGIAERLRQVGGQLVAGPVGDGWLVRISVPLAPDQRRQEGRWS